MLDVLHFKFSSFWVFAGTVILLGMLIKLIAIILCVLIAAIRGGKISVS